MDPLLWIKNTSYFGNRFQPGEGEVHVLVVALERAVGSASETSMTEQLAKDVREIHEQTVLTKRKRYTHSKVDSALGKQLLNDLNIKVDPVRTVPFAAGNGTPADVFTWESVIVEDGQVIVLTEEQQRERYRTHVERNIGAVIKDKNLYVKGVEKSENTLSVEVPGRNIDLVGRTDLLILSDLVLENPSDVQYLPGVKMLIEMKREVKASSDFQALSELIALDLLVDNPVMALLTDLNGMRAFFWASERKDNSARIYKATIKKPGEAFQVIRTLLEQSPTAGAEISLPAAEEEESTTPPRIITARNARTPTSKQSQPKRTQRTMWHNDVV
ncbi:hypothetical protein BBP00_00005582 [Phytophthora kernoviae]|uniref:Crinkler effector protein N-terminal domain-containing protein n=1 Tax=Phytophthora kernoviae TaxID=325452 RepID=A0A3F2RNN4_9STRA|nr:hypothetical protein BBP00_00005582 [Phytophthora kernoviae]